MQTTTKERYGDDNVDGNCYRMLFNTFFFLKKR